jgi:hypothetical protein
VITEKKVFTVGVVSPGARAGHAAMGFVLMGTPGSDLPIYLGLIAKITATR